MDIKADLEQQVKALEMLGHPAIKERFLLRNGKLFTPKPITGRRMQLGMCFHNASKAADDGRFPGGVYVEGFGFREGLFPIHHAWVGVDNTAYDVTWEGPENCQYLGVEIEAEERWVEQLRTEYYAILENPATMINTDFIFARDPELKPIVEQIIGHPIIMEGEAA